MRIVFMGTPDFSVPVLEALVDADHEICAVYCQPPRPAGRGKKDRPSPVQTRAKTLGLTVHHPKSLRNDEALAEFTGLNADIAVVVAYGLILPQEILDAPRRGCLNIHASLLPRWRGAAPIHRAIMAGDTETGICIMQMDAGLDTGDVLLRDTTPIGAEETTADLHDRLSAMGARLMAQTLSQLDNLTPRPQPEDGVTYAKKIDKAEARTDVGTDISGDVDFDANLESVIAMSEGDTSKHYRVMQDGQQIGLLHMRDLVVALVPSEASDVGIRATGG